MAKIIITGSGGMVGKAFIEILKERNKDFAGFTHSELDVTDRKNVFDVFSSLMPSIVIHAAAWTDVDGCERNPERAFFVNEKGTENVVMACAENRVNLVYLSTDFVFNGKKKSPYTEDDLPEPINVYGASKLAGEEKVRKSLKSYFIVRSSWLFGKGRKNFVTKVLELADKGNILKIVDDQVGTPTYARDLASAILNLVDTSQSGIYHITNSGCASRYEWGRAILEYSGIKDVEIIPIKHKDFFEEAARPVFSALGTNYSKMEIRDWRGALKEYMNNFNVVRA